MVVCGLCRFMVFQSVARCFAAQRFDVSSWAKANPIKTTTISASLRGFLGDLAAQKLEQQAAAEPIDDGFKIDSRRLLLYTSFTNLVAFTYDKPIYTRLFPRMFPTLIDGVRHWGNAVKSAVFEAVITTPLFYFPLFYLFKESVVAQRRGPLDALRHMADELPTPGPASLTCPKSRESM